MMALLMVLSRYIIVQGNQWLNESKWGGARGTGAYANGFDKIGAGLGRLENKEINVTQKGLTLVENHLVKFGSNPENTAMIARLRNILETGQKISGADESFNLHEAAEATIMARLMKGGMTFDETYNLGHATALQKYGVSLFSVYHPEVISAFPELFNSNWFMFWEIIK